MNCHEDEVKVEFTNDPPGMIAIFITRESDKSNLPTRVMRVKATEDRLKALAKGENPVRDGWTNDVGMPICWENGIGYFVDRGCIAESVYCSFVNGEVKLYWDDESGNYETDVFERWCDWDEEQRLMNRATWGWVMCKDYWSFTKECYSIIDDTSHEIKIYLSINDKVYFVESFYDSDYDASLSMFDTKYGTHLAHNPDVEIIGVSPDKFQDVTQIHSAEDLEAILPKEITAIKTIINNGTSLSISVTKEVQALGLDRGDAVEVTLRHL